MIGLINNRCAGWISLDDVCPCVNNVIHAADNVNGDDDDDNDIGNNVDNNDADNVNDDYDDDANNDDNNGNVNNDNDDDVVDDVINDVDNDVNNGNDDIDTKVKGENLPSKSDKYFY